MIGRAKRKLLWCDTCNDEKMCDSKSSLVYVCRGCKASIDVVKASNAKSRRKREARAAKAGSCKPDPAYMAFVREKPCLRCGRPGPSHAHHSVHVSQGGSDRSCVPLCTEHHGEYHDRHGSVPAALAAWGIDLRAEARMLNREFSGGAPELDDGEELP